MAKKNISFALPLILFFMLTPFVVFAQQGDTFDTLMDGISSQTIKAIVTSFFFVGSFFVMGIYMMLLYIQNKKNDYLLYSLYLLVFTYYFFLRLDDVFRFDLFGDSYVVHQHLLTPLLLVITSIYVRFINSFAEIGTFDKSFSKRLNIFCVLLLITASSMVIYTMITKDFEGIRKNRSYFTLPMHAYTLLALIRAFRIIKTRIRHYILWSNIFLFTFSIIGVYWANSLPGRETITSNSLFGFYAFNASQLGIFLEMICFSLGLGYKFGLIEKEKDEVKEKYILELKKNEAVSKQLNEELTELVKERTQEIQDKNELLKQEQELKSTFFTNISHEFRTPITLISGPVQDLLAKRTLPEGSQESLEMIDRNSKKLLSLVEQLLDISELDAGSMSLRLEKGDVQTFMRSIFDPFKYLAEQKSIKFNVEHQYSENQVWYDAGILEKVMVNLLSNALKYTPKGGSVSSKITVDGKVLEFIIKNSGAGLSQNELDKIFDRFYRTNDSGVPGTGIGLALVKDLIDLNLGRISVESKQQEWTTFHMVIPVNRSAFASEDFAKEPRTYKVQNNGIEENTKVSSPKNTSVESDLPTILIVDDNEDVLEYLNSLLKANYNLLMAVNGEKAMDLAKSQSPDLVLSDVMMPVVDGIELSKNLKSDVLTSHIPIVLLTAKAGEKNVLEGIEIGVDDYITKPFKNEFLLAKIATLLDNRKRIRSHYSANLGLKPKRMVFNSVESQFLKKLQEVINECIQAPDFNVAEFCNYMGLGRMQLHRKLKATLGISASEFLNHERLKSAQSMLANSDLTVSEIAYLSGFGSPAYFTKMFKKRYNNTPTLYRKEHSSI